VRHVRFLAQGRLHHGTWGGEVLLDEAGRAYRSTAVTWLPPVAPSKILGFALTYADHAAELGVSRPDELALFSNRPPRSSATAHRSSIPPVWSTCITRRNWRW